MHITYEQLMELISRGVPKKQVKGVHLRDCDNFKKIKGAMHR